jgi:hypothetical protein
MPLFILSSTSSVNQFDSTGSAGSSHINPLRQQGQQVDCLEVRTIDKTMSEKE